MTFRSPGPESGADDKRSRGKAGAVMGGGSDTETPSLKLAKKYLSLGGRRRSKIDDNITDVRQWDEDPPEAERFWKERVETLSKDERKQVEDFLPTINTP
ncbi:hypothetical protein HJB84_02000 [Rhizobium sp. NZLR1b]|uniref:hypothetical protein n=1 Tax=unclassified Rhizobium TaxID=2613769 RepID=UPI001C831E06|nr:MULTISPECIES: hypothetical protein [unclassified Rhizobium]MBX5168640.1 hypothetical protein [Rhizobium sp. NZLR1b]MBX5194286.1 hypothetical protein [Rhizobium sp. NZLR10]